MRFKSEMFNCHRQSIRAEQGFVAAFMKWKPPFKENQFLLLRSLRLRRRIQCLSLFPVICRSVCALSPELETCGLRGRRVFPNHVSGFLTTSYILAASWPKQTENRAILERDIFINPLPWPKPKELIPSFGWKTPVFRALDLIQTLSNHTIIWYWQDTQQMF